MRIRNVHSAFWLDVALQPGILVLLVLLTALTFTLVTRATVHPLTSKPFCNPNGQLILPNTASPGSNNTFKYSPYWHPTMFLSITLGFGKFSYPAAKAIDACWDLIVGKGGQLLLGITTYRVLRRSLVLVMERMPLTIPTFTSVATEGLSLSTLGKLAVSVFIDPEKEERDHSSKSRLSGKLWLAASVYVCTYVLAFGTLTSVMTGYQAQYGTYVNSTGSGGLTSISDLYVPAIVVIDGSRVGVGNDFATGGLASANDAELHPSIAAKAFAECKSLIMCTTAWVVN